MKKRIILCLLIALSFKGYAQGVDPSKQSIQFVVDACFALREAFSKNDNLSLKQSAESLREAPISSFSTLHCRDTIALSLNGHLIFDSYFVELLVDDAGVLERADEIQAELDRKNRGQAADGSIRTRTCMVQAGKSVKYEFASKGLQELAVVAEPGGLVTLKVHVTNRDGLDLRFDDTKNVKIGLPHRYVSFQLPEDRRNVVELEVINCAAKDCSFVIISN